MDFYKNQNSKNNSIRQTSSDSPPTTSAPHVPAQHSRLHAASLATRTNNCTGESSNSHGVLQTWQAALLHRAGLPTVAPRLFLHSAENCTDTGSNRAMMRANVQLPLCRSQLAAALPLWVLLLLLRRQKRVIMRLRRFSSIMIVPTSPYLICCKAVLSGCCRLDWKWSLLVVT